ncbi:hypothetical protein [Streptomyces sp. NPDC060022]|uniref:hypothetical protein n=1 Tax=Streptomyces sp. NPDC060022 TaxID=3347039 RepID=UPI00367B760F
MSHVETETAGQPECWRRAAEVAADRAAVLPATGERIRRGLTGTPTDRAAGGCSTRRTVRRTAEGRGQASSK